MPPGAGDKFEATDRLDWACYAIVLFCIFSFKLILIGVGESGIRADDLLLLAAAAILAFKGDFKTIPRSRAFNLYLVFVAVNLASALWCSAQGRVSLPISLFFVVRLLQYQLFYYLGFRIAASGRSLHKALTIYLWLMAVVVPLQMAGILPVPGNFVGITSRAVGNTNGPYELAVIGAFLLCYLGYHAGSRIKGTVAAGLVLLSASRITFAAMIVSLLLTYLRRSQAKLKFAAVLLLLLVSIGIVYSLLPAGGSYGGGVKLVERISTMSVAEYPSQFAMVYQLIPSYDNSKDYYDGEFIDATDQAVATTGNQGDVSSAIRLFRWASLIKSTLAHTDSIWLGLGPSFGTAAVDGYFVRLFAETGLLGLAAFLAFAAVLMFGREGSSWPFQEYVFLVLASCCFVDIGVSYKPMLLLWLWHGMHQAELSRAEERSYTAEQAIPPLETIVGLTD